MSNYLAIATVTAGLKHLLQSGIRDEVPGAVVTTMRPDKVDASSQASGINLYLYLATPNPTWRNADLRTQRPKGDLTRHGQAGLNLHYLLTFYGNEQELESQRLMGSAVRALVDNPILTEAMIQETVTRSNFPFLAESTLGEQAQQVTFVPSTITSEELSRIWSVFSPLPYALSFAVQAMAVLIQGDKSGKLSLPVRRRSFSVMPNRPMITKVEPKGMEDQKLTCDGQLVITGQQLSQNNIRVQIGQARVTPQLFTDTQVTLRLGQIPANERQALRAGVQGVQIIHLTNSRFWQAESEPVVESNVLPLVLCPTILPGKRSITLANLEERDEDLYWADVTVQLDMTVGATQRVFLLMNGLGEQSKTYIFRAVARSTDTASVQFALQSVVMDRYLVRVQVDGAESPLEFDDNQFTGPIVEVGDEAGA